MAVNCKILDYINNWLTIKRFRLSKPTTSNGVLINQFNQSTGCNPIDSCFIDTEPCLDETFHICTLAIDGLNLLVIPDGTLIVTPEGVTGGVSPYIGTWVFDSADFNYLSGQGTDSLHLTVKESSGDNSDISLTLTDSEKCIGRVTDNVLIPHANIDCDTFSLSGVAGLYKGIPYIGVLRVEYDNGNGKPYGDYTIESTGVTGVLTGFDLNTGFGILEFQVSGTPNDSGNITFTANLFGTTCSFTTLVDDTYCPSPFVGTTTQDYDSGSDEYTMRILWLVTGNAISYDVTYSIDGVDQAPVTINSPINHLDIQVLSELDFAGTVTANCSLTSVSGSTSFSGTAPAAPTCSAPTGFGYTVGAYDVATDTYSVSIHWTAVIGATGYTVTLVSVGVPVPISGTSTTIDVQSSNTEGVILKTVCSGGGISLGSTNPVTTPSAPLPPLPVLPIINRMFNVSGSPSHIDMWVTLDSAQLTARIFQGDLFSSYLSDTGSLTKGISNGYTPTPVGFASDDVYFNGPSAPHGYPIVGAAMTKVKMLVSTTGLIYTFEFLMNVPQAYTIRQDTLDYIPLYDDGVVRPLIVVNSISAGTADLGFDPQTLVYDYCSSFNFFLRSAAGGIVTGSGAAYLGSGFIFTGLSAGDYMVFLEITHDACTISPIPYVTAVPMLITIP